MDIPQLTPRQIQVGDLLARGLQNKLIAIELGISEDTVKVHLRALTAKFGAHNRTEVAVAVAAGRAYAEGFAAGQKDVVSRSVEFGLGKLWPTTLNGDARSIA